MQTGRLFILATAVQPCGIRRRKSLLTRFAADCDTDAEKEQAFYGLDRMAILNTTMTTYLSFSIFDVQKTGCEPNKVFVLFAALVRRLFAGVKISLAMLLTEYPIKTAQIGTLGTACTMTGLGGMLI